MFHYRIKTEDTVFEATSKDGLEFNVLCTDEFTDSNLYTRATWEEVLAIISIMIDPDGTEVTNSNLERLAYQWLDSNPDIANSVVRPIP